MYIALATNIALVFPKQQDGSKAREMGDTVQQVARSSMLKKLSKSSQEGKNLDWSTNLSKFCYIVKTTKIPS